MRNKAKHAARRKEAKSRGSKSKPAGRIVLAAVAPVVATVADAAITPSAPPVVDIHERHARIAQQAYLLSEQAGFPAGAHIEHWLRAERDVDASL